jgi:hypothetical protein
MAYINTIETESIQTGVAPVAPIAAVDIWPSLDPSVPFSQQVNGINNFLAITNQVGLYNGIGLQSITGLSSLIGFKTGVGGQTNAEPNQVSAAQAFTMSSPLGDLNGFWKYNAKKNINTLENSLDKVKNLRGVSFQWNEDVVPDLASKEPSQIGLIAQEVEEVIPQVVYTTTVENQSLKSIKYENLTALLIEAVKEQQEQINTLKQTVQELSTKLAECCP